jgi:hypothetical protein
LNGRFRELVGDDIEECFRTERLLFGTGFASSRFESEETEAKDRGTGREEHGFSS